MVTEIIQSEEVRAILRLALEKKLSKDPEILKRRSIGFNYLGRKKSIEFESS